MGFLYVNATQIFDSRGNPTVQVVIETTIGESITPFRTLSSCQRPGRFVAGVPSGASTGSHEAVEMRDNESTYSGKGACLQHLLSIGLGGYQELTVLIRCQPRCRCCQ